MRFACFFAFQPFHVFRTKIHRYRIQQTTSLTIGGWYELDAFQGLRKPYPHSSCWSRESPCLTYGTCAAWLNFRCWRCEDNPCLCICTQQRPIHQVVLCSYRRNRRVFQAQVQGPAAWNDVSVCVDFNSMITDFSKNRCDCMYAGSVLTDLLKNIDI